MRKLFITLGLIIVSAAVGGITAYIIMKNAADARRIAAALPASGEWRPVAERGAYPDDLTYAAETAVQAVVNIEVTQMVNVRQPRNPLLEFFGYSQPDAAPRERKSGGSGVVVSHDGYIVTNSHVVQNAAKLRVKLYDGRTFDAEIIGADDATDIALIKVAARGLPSLVMGDSDGLRLGERVLAIGSPFDLHSTITAGIVSAKARTLGTTESIYGIESFIQTDAAVNPGNSGGALVNTRGELIGINTLIKSPTGTFSGYSFAVPVSIVSRVIDDLREYGVAQRGLLGVSYVPVTDGFVEVFGAEYGIGEPGGFYVGAIDPNGAARVAGIEEGDVIFAVNDVILSSSANLSEVMSRYRPNDRVKISVKRDGKVKHFDVTLRNKAGKAELLDRDHIDVEDELGGTFAEVDRTTMRELEISHGIRVVDILYGGILSDAGVSEGFIITHINDRPVRSIADLADISERVTSFDGVYPEGRRVGYVLE